MGMLRGAWIAGLALATFLPVPTEAADYRSMTIKFADVINRNFGYYHGMVALKNEVEKKSGGKIKVEILTDGVMGTAKDVLEAAQIGTVQMAMNTAAYTQNVIPEHGIYNLPYLFKDRKTWQEFSYGPMGQELGAKIEKRGLKFLTWNSAGGRGIVNRRKPLARPADFTGLKIRTMPDPVIVDTIKAVNGQPVVMNLPEVFTSLQQGVVDGADVSIELVTAFKFHEVAKYYTETQHIMTPGMVVANLGWWNSLNKDTQALLLGAIPAFRKANDSWFIEVDPTAPAAQQAAKMKVLTDKGMVITKPDIPALKAATAPVVERYQDKIGKAYVESVMRAVGY